MNHYKIHKPEPIDLILKYNLNFIEGSIVKYILRSPFKGDRIGDLKKALYYSNLLKEIGYFRHIDPDEFDDYEELCLLEKEALFCTIRSEIFSDLGDDIGNYVSKLIDSAIQEREDNKIQSVTK